jgi:protein-S-isoprenylcysteine O-methyltransferase Ste14
MDVFHAIFIGVVLAFTGIRMYYHRLAQRQMGPAAFREGRGHVAWRVALGLPWLAALLAYMARPSLLDWARIPLPEWAPWLGAGLGLASLPLIAWVQWALGANFSTVLHVRDRHTLVTHGPYRWVRHPMYTVLAMFCLSVLLLTGNLIVGGVPVAALALIVVTRVRREETAMAEKFGEAYQAYMQRTGRFLPGV